MIIHAVLFDVGGVLLRTEDPAPRRALEDRLGLAHGALADLVFNNPVSIAASLGKATPRQIWEHVAERLSFPKDSLEELQKGFWAGDRWDQALIDFVKDLRPERRTAVVSNAWPDARQAFAPLETCGAFETLIISAEEGMMKPDPRIFQLALDRLETQPDRAVLVDDTPVNLKSAAALGIHAVRFTNQEEVMAELRRMLGRS